MDTLEHLSDAQMADEITTWAGRVAAGEAHLLALIAEFDRREAWANVGVLSCAHWLSWRLGLGLKAAYERVRVARALTHLPATMTALTEGRLSWCQVRAITRVATSADEQTYVDAARHATGAQLEKLVRGVRRVQKIAEDEADPQAAAHNMRTRVSYDADGMLVVSMRLPAEEGAVVLAALEQARADLDRRRRVDVDTVDAHSSAEDSPTEPGASAPATLTEAILHIMRGSLAATAQRQPDLDRRERFRLVAQVDPLSGWGRLVDGELLPPIALTGAAGALPTRGHLRPLQAGDLTAADLGRSARLPNRALRELLTTVDSERCRFPSCTRRRRLHAHHVQHWSAGGVTDLRNLVLLCARHHTLTHLHGFRLSLKPDRTLSVTTADGRRVAHHPRLPWQSAVGLDPDQSITATTLPPAPGGRLDLRYAVAVLTQQAA